MKYHISVNGQTMGPFEPEQLINQCGLTMNSYVWNETMTGWQLASTVRELVDLLNAKRQSQPVKYCISINGQTVGPSEPEQLISQYGLTMNSYVWNESMPNWQLAGTVPELATLLAQKAHANPNNLGVNQEQMSAPDVSVQSIANPKEADLDVIIVEENTNQPKESKPKKVGEVNDPDIIVVEENNEQSNRKGVDKNNQSRILSTDAIANNQKEGIQMTEMEEGYVKQKGKYEPGISFKKFRKSEEELRSEFTNRAIWKIIVAVLAIGFIYLMFSSGAIDNLVAKKGASVYAMIFKVFIVGGGAIGAVWSAYSAIKLLKVHGDVDYEANEYLAEALGADVDEIVQVSTQNFDGTEQIYSGCKILVVTNRKLYFAYFKKKKWHKCVQEFNQIRTIGISLEDKDTKAVNMTINFFDKTNVDIKLSIENHESTTPYLFVKMFLETLDNYLLGTTAEVKPSRRRVTTTRQTKEVSQNDSVYVGISQSEVVTGRKLDL